VLAELMFASGVGEPVAAEGDFGSVEPTKGLVLSAGDAITDLVTAYAGRRHLLARPGGKLDCVEMLGWLLCRVLRLDLWAMWVSSGGVPSW
jgi:hypothetical protein